MKRDKRIYVRLTEAEEQQMKRTASMYDMGLGDFLRTMSRWVERTQPRLVVEPQGVKANER